MNHTILVRAAVAAALVAASPWAATVAGPEGAASLPAPAASAVAPAPSGAAAPAATSEGRSNERTGDLAPRPEPVTAPEGVPTREQIDRYVEQRRQAIDAQLRATDPWGQYRRDWREGRRQLRRDSRDLFRAAPGFPGYPWGPVAPYYGSPWGEPIPPAAPSREATDEFFQRQHEAIEQQHGWKGPWTPYLGAVPGDPRSTEERMLRRNPWAPPAPQP